MANPDVLSAEYAIMDAIRKHESHVAIAALALVSARIISENMPEMAVDNILDSFAQVMREGVASARLQPQEPVGAASWLC